MRWKCHCAYDGTDFQGWQSQVGGNTVQDILERRLKAVFQQTIRIHGSARTDSGVHAKEQVFHFDAEWSHPPPELLRAFRSNLPKTIQVFRVQRAPKTFHARYSARGKRYIYQIFQGYAPPMETRYFWSIQNTKLNIEAMRAAAEHIIGKRDFAVLAAKSRDKRNRQKGTIKDLRRLDIIQRGPRIRIVSEADGYLYKMMRILVGILVEVGLAKLTLDEVKDLLAKRVRTQAVVTAPAQGLYLERVFY